jgi:hypothetical protein
MRLVASTYPSEELHDHAFSALTHRLLVSWWRNAGSTYEEKLRNYFRLYNFISSLRMSSFQFLDCETVLILYGDNWKKMETLVFAVYNLVSSQIEAIFDDDDADFLKIISENIYEFILPTLTRTQASQIGRRNCNLYKSFIEYHLPHESYFGRRKIARLLPCLCQSYRISPYFDDEHFQWSLDRIKPFKMVACSHEECKVVNDIIFLNRANDSRFCLEDTAQAFKFIFHPTEPLVMSGKLAAERTAFLIRYNLHYYSSR